MHFRISLLGLVLSSIALLAMGCASDAGLAYYKQTIGHINLCGTVRNGTTKLALEDVTFRPVLVSKATGTVVELSNTGATKLDSEGYGCVMFTCKMRDGSSCNTFGKAMDFPKAYRLISLGVESKLGTVEGRLSDSNLHEMVKDPVFQDLFMLTVDTDYDYKDPNTGDPGQISRILRKLLERQALQTNPQAIELTRSI